jgi:hypothetical protein
MALSLEDEWVLVVSGLIAHADGVLEAEECDRLLGMLGPEPDPSDYSDWLTFFSDLEALRRRYDALHNPTPGQVQPILEAAWGMAMVDGSDDEAEVAILHEVGQRMGIAPAKLDELRVQWVTNLDAFAELAAECGSYVLSGTGPLPDADRSTFADFVGRLPTDVDSREVIRASMVLRARGGLGGKLAATGNRMRDLCLRLLAGLAHEAQDDERATSRFMELALEANLNAVAAGALLEATR